MTLLRWVDLESNCFRINVIENGKFCKLKSKGCVNYRATLFALTRLISDYQFDSSYKIVIDFEETDFDFSTTEIDGILKYISHLKEFHTNRFAIILPDIENSMSGYLVSKCKSAGLEIDIFYGTAELDRWLAAATF